MKNLIPVKIHLNVSFLIIVALRKMIWLNMNELILVKSHTDVNFVIKILLESVHRPNIKEFTLVKNHINANFVVNILHKNLDSAKFVEVKIKKIKYCTCINFNQSPSRHVSKQIDFTSIDLLCPKTVWVGSETADQIKSNVTGRRSSVPLSCNRPLKNILTVW